MGLLLDITAINTITNDSIKWCRTCVISDSNLAGYGVQAIKRPICLNKTRHCCTVVTKPLIRTYLYVRDGSVF